VFGADAEARDQPTEDFSMKTGIAFATTLFAIAGFPLVGQQAPAGSQPDNPAAQQSPSGAEAMPSRPSASPAAPAIDLRPINGELVSKLDSRTAKTGDSVVVETKSSAKTADGTEIPKGSKLVGHVLGVQSSGGAENSQVALVLDHIELKGGQNVPIRSQIQSIAPAGGAASAGASGPMSAPPAGNSSPGASGSSGASGVPQAASNNAGSGAQAAQGSGGPPAGTVVAKTGLIAISTTSIPGVLLANNAPGQQDPRMARASSILLGAKQDIELESGTQMVVGVSSTSGGTQ
jgi:hypothetical protein